MWHTWLPTLRSGRRLALIVLADMPVSVSPFLVRGDFFFFAASFADDRNQDRADRNWSEQFGLHPLSILIFRKNVQRFFGCPLPGKTNAAVEFLIFGALAIQRVAHSMAFALCGVGSFSQTHRSRVHPFGVSHATSWTPLGRQGDRIDSKKLSRFLFIWPRLI